MSAASMLAQARKSLGLGEPNHIQRWYAQRNGSAYSYNFPWCDAAITYWAYHSGNHAAVCPNGDRAYTVYHAQDFQRAGRWRAGTTANVNSAHPGDIMFVDWAHSNSIGAIDHVGIVEKVLGGGRVQTIEGNTSNQCLRRVRDASVIAGFGRPNYGDEPSTPAAPSTGAGTSSWMEEMMRNLPVVKLGARGEHVQSIQGLLQARSHPEVAIDGEFGPMTKRAVEAVQRWGGVTADGEVGPQTWPVLLRVHQ